MATLLRGEVDEVIRLLSLSFGVDVNQQLKLVGIVPNQVQGVREVEVYAKVVVEQARYLLR